MLKIAGRNQEACFQVKDIEKFPSRDLYTIEELWVTYSKGHFGFSVQKNIWQEVQEDWHKFGVSVGWRKKYKYAPRERFQWISKDELTFSFDVPLGHLPAVFPCATQSRGFSACLVWSIFSKFQQEEEETLGIYERLKCLLAVGKWREANYETRRIMLKIAGRSKQGNFQVEDIDNLLCRDLYIIDKLWVTYSKGHFGFSVQKNIWQEVQEDWHEFGSSVGWRDYDKWGNFQWVSKEEITFNLNAPLGHLPAVFPCVTQSRGFSARLIWSLLSKFEFIPK